jgi:hypothetical protein
VVGVAIKRGSTERWDISGGAVGGVFGGATGTDLGKISSMSDSLEQIKFEMKELDRHFTASYEQAVLVQQYRLGKFVQRGYLERKLHRWQVVMRNLFNKDSSKNRAMDNVGKNIADDFMRPYDTDLHQRLDQVCMFYLAGETKDRESMREFAHNQASLLYGLERHPQWCARQLDATKNQQFLKTGLSAVSLYDLKTLSNTEINLEFLYRSGVNAGIDPKPDFKDVAALSAPTGRHPGYRSTQDVIAGFEPTGFLEKRVLPHLAE